MDLFGLIFECLEANKRLAGSCVWGVEQLHRKRAADRMLDQPEVSLDSVKKMLIQLVDEGEVLSNVHHHGVRPDRFHCWTHRVVARIAPSGIGGEERAEPPGRRGLRLVCPSLLLWHLGYDS